MGEKRQGCDQLGYCPFSYFWFTYLFVIYNQHDKPMSSSTFNRVYLYPEMKPNGFQVF